MYQRILIATDGSELAEKGVSAGLELAKVLGAHVTIVTVTQPWTIAVPGEMAVAFPVKEYEDAAQQEAKTILGKATKTAETYGLTCDTRHIPDAYAADGIIEAQKDDKSDLIVMASHGRSGLTRVVLGSQASAVVSQSSVPVLICR